MEEGRGRGDATASQCVSRFWNMVPTMETPMARPRARRKEYLGDACQKGKKYGELQDEVCMLGTWPARLTCQQHFQLLLLQRVLVLR